MKNIYTSSVFLFLTIKAMGLVERYDARNDKLTFQYPTGNWTSSGKLKALRLLSKSFLW